MDRRQFTAALWAGGAMAALAATPFGAWAAALGERQAASGVRAALERGVRAAVARLGRPDGFLGDERVRIPLPDFLHDAQRLLRATGQQRRVDELVTAMNRAAEAAVPEATDLLLQTAREVSVTDALAMVRGGDTGVTDHFAERTREPLTAALLPIVTRATERVALAERYNALAGRARSLNLVRPEQANLQQHVTSKALDALYLVIGDEERKLRADPVAAGSDLLRRVFGR
jgi:hypothetical protein